MIPSIVRKKILSVLIVQSLLTSLCLADGGQIRVLYDQAVDLYQQGQYDQAIAKYEEITRLTPQFAPAYTGIALTLKAKNASQQEVMKYLKKAIEMDPNYAPAHDYLGKIHYSLGQMDQAETYLKKAVELDPGSVTAYLSLGWIYLLHQQDSNKAVESFQRVLQDGKNPAASYGLGLSYLSQENRMKVMEIVTELRMMQEEKLALELETMLRENRYVLEAPSAPKVAASETEENASLQPLPKEDYSEVIESGGLGIPVRLRGKLNY